MIEMKQDAVGQSDVGQGNPEKRGVVPSVSTVFMNLARHALAGAGSSGMPPEEDLRRLAKWCDLHRHELLRLSRVQDDPESKQRRIWLLELATMPSGRWVDLRSRLGSFIRLFGLPPRAQYEPFLSREAIAPDVAPRIDESWMDTEDEADLEIEDGVSLVVCGSSG